MKKALRLISILCLIALLLQGCGAGKTNDKEKPGQKPNDKPVDLGPKTETTSLTEEELYDKIAGGWIGQMVGVAWAASTEFTHAGKLIEESSMPKWSPDMINDAFGQDDLYVEIPFLDAMKENGFDCDPKFIAEKFRDSKFALWHANYMGRENLLNGIPYPLSGSYQYNYHADDIDWQIEADFLGMMYPGMVDAAAERAFELGHIMNYGDGVYGGVFVSAMHSAAFTAKSLEEIWTAGIEVIPEGTQFRALLDDVVASYKAGDTFEKNWRKLQLKWANTDLCPELPGVSNIDAKLNSGYILLGLLYGEGDINKTIILSTRCGQDSDCNPSSAASILGNYYGASGLPENYASALNRNSTKFSYTEYTFEGAMQLNLDLTKKVLLHNGAKVEGTTYTFERDIRFTPVKFEQWPDGVFGYLSLKMKGNTVSITELTPYAKNEKVTGFTLAMGDGYVFTDAAPASYTYEKAGTYTIVLTVKGDKGSSTEVKKTVKASGTGKVLDTMIISSVLTPWGGGSRDINIICDGVIPAKNNTDMSKQYDTYILGDPHGNPETIEVYIGYQYRTAKKVSTIEFTEGGHFGDGGWFKGDTLQIEVLINGKWTSVGYSCAPKAYPKPNSGSAHGSGFETYTFTLDTPQTCNGVRLIGVGGGSKTFISVSELVVK